MIRAEALTRDQSVALINRCFRDLLMETDKPYILSTAEPDMEIREQRTASEDRLFYLERQVTAGRAEPTTGEWLRTYLAERGVELPSGSAGHSDLLALGLLRAMAEQQRAFQYRLEEAVLPFVPTDPLFVTPDDQDRRRQADIEATAVGPTMAQLADKYLTARRSQWTVKTYKLNEQKLGFVVEFLGSTRRASSVSAQDIRAYRSAVARLRLGHHTGAGRDFQARLTDDSNHQITAKTASLHFSTCKTLFRWAKAEGYIPFNPGADIQFDQPKVQKGKKARRPFKAEELKTIFSAPVFTGCQSIRRRFTPGGLRVRDAYFWIPLLAYYGGFRLGELVQLHVGDVHLDGPVPYIEVTEDNSGDLGSDAEKHVKSEAGIRRVPLHEDVMALGFRQFLKDRRKDHKARKRLFWEVSFGRDGQASSAFSKWFGRLLDKIGLDDPTLVFHSLRHGMEDAFRNSLTPQYVIDRVIGHSDGKVSSQYGEGASLDVAYQAVLNLKMPVSVPTILDG